MVSGQRNLGRTNEVHVVSFEPVDIFSRLAQEARAFHRTGKHDGGRDHRDEAVRRGLPDCQVEQRELQERPGSGQVEEARS